MNALAWLRAAVLADPQRFGLLVAAQALPEARLRGPRSLALARSEVEAIAADPLELHTAVLGLAGPQSPLPAAMARELSTLESDSAAAGLIGLIEDRLLQLLVLAQVRRAVDDPAAHHAMLERLLGPLADAERLVAGRLCDGPTADGLAVRLAAVAGCAVRVIAATGGSLPLGPGRSDALGDARLGEEQVVGCMVSAPELGCRIELGPVTASMAQRLRPGGTDHAAILAVLGRGLPACLQWELQLLVEPAAAVPCGMGELGRTLRLDGPLPTVERETLARFAA